LNGAEQVTRAILNTKVGRHMLTLALVWRGDALSCNDGPLVSCGGPRPFGGGSATLCDSSARPVVDWVFLARHLVPLCTGLVPCSGAPSSFRGAPSGSGGAPPSFDNDLVALGNRCAAQRMQGQGCASAQRVLLISPSLHFASHIEKETGSL